MQVQLSYYPDPGIITDAVKITSIKLNDRIFIKPSYAVYGFDAEEVNHCLQETACFSPPPKELLLFFYKDSAQNINFMTHYLTCMLRRTFTDFSLASFQNSFSDHGAITKALFEHYLGSSNYMNSNYESTIRSNTTLPDRIKFYLLGFCINPASYIHLLLKTLDSYCWQIREKYRSSHESFHLDLSALETFVLSTFPNDASAILSRPLAYSYCNVMRDYLCFNQDQNQNWIIVGSKFTNVVSNLEHGFQMPFEIEKICNAASDSSRIRILSYLHMHPHQSTKQIQSALSLPSSSIHYHIKILQEAQLINCQRKKTGNVFSLNSPAFKKTTEFFSAFSHDTPCITNNL